MCGIAGVFAVGSLGGDEAQIVDRMSALMQRRGPDDSGFWSDQQTCALGFRRLSILDLSPSGHQPMRSADERFVLVYNGELYNFRELRRELEAEGDRFRSTGDTEVVLAALARWGRRALERFNGMFALAFYDTREQRLLLARDHAGIKPLYYLATAQGLVFGSQYDQILSHPWSHPLPVSTAALGVYLRQGYIPAPYALLEQTAQVEPGSWLTIDRTGRVETGSYYEFPRNPVPDLSGPEADEAVDAAVTQAVRRQLISDVPLGTFLSGGIDSPLVAAKMRAVRSGPVRAFTIGTEGDALDESGQAANYARALGLDQTILQASPAQALAILDDVVAACSEPFADFSIFPTLLVAQEARKQVTVMLSGDGGDELFWGYVGRFGSVLEQAEAFRRPLWWRSLRWGLKKQFGLGHATANVRRPSIGQWVHEKHCHLKESWARAIFPGLAPDPTESTLFAYQGWQVDETAQWLRWNEFSAHLTRVLLKVDRASMHHSLEVRVPLLDREVIDTAARIDWRSCLDLSQGVKRGVGKRPLRAALARHIPTQSQEKRGFSVPMSEWLRGPLRPVLEDALLSRQDLVGLPLDRAALRRYADEHLTGRHDHAWGLWILLSLALWEARHFQARTGELTNVV